MRAAILLDQQYRSTVANTFHNAGVGGSSPPITTNSKLAAIYFPNLKFYLDKRNTACFPKRFEKPKGNSFL
ncbi:MAG: hypothetical protein CFH29_00430 [Alphaproteobacteria bacterium MarineAlpha7_Bin1]|nr:MAG: hypothetical protein CFH29_00430 [Alphaproteobacteria bacterium MarineAlpha7_Bin1]